MRNTLITSFVLISLILIIDTRSIPSQNPATPTQSFATGIINCKNTDASITVTTGVIQDKEAITITNFIDALKKKNALTTQEADSLAKVLSNVCSNFNVWLKRRDQSAPPLSIRNTLFSNNNMVLLKLTPKTKGQSKPEEILFLLSREKTKVSGPLVDYLIKEKNAQGCEPINDQCIGCEGDVYCSAVLLKGL